MKQALLNCTLGLCMLAALAPQVRAQSDAADATASVNLLTRTVSVVNTAGLDFGDVLAGANSFVFSSDIPTAAAWLVDVAGTTQVELSFSLPAALMNAGGTSSIPVTYQTQAASIHEGANPAVTFNPGGTPFAFAVDPSGTQFEVRLGEDVPNNGSGDVAINISTAQPGVHTAVATLTVTIM